MSAFAGSDIIANLIESHCVLSPPESGMSGPFKTGNEGKGHGRLSFPAKFAQTSNWPYLQAVVS